MKRTLRRRGTVAFPGASPMGDHGSLQRRRPARRRRRLTPAEVRFLDDLERVVHAIRFPVDNASIFQLQLAYALDRAGFYVVKEVPMSLDRRVDMVAIRGGVKCAVECDRFSPRAATFGKFQDVPDEVLKAVVLRRRNTPLVLPWADRTVTTRATLKMIGMLTDGTSSLIDFETVDRMQRDRGEVVPVREGILIANFKHKSAAAPARIRGMR